MSRFDEDVYRLVRCVPVGRVISYGALARALGQPGKAREVGWALSRCPADVPAHRVVNREGRLSGGWAFGAPEIQRLRLEAEGVCFSTPERLDLERYGWQPHHERPFDAC